MDNSPSAVQTCLAKGLTVLHRDVIEYVGAEVDQLKRFDAVYCAHVVEHLQPKEVFLFFDLLFRGMRPGARLLIVTPNAEDIEVACSNFWLDLTHVRMYPRILVERMLLNSGFSGVESCAIYGLGINRTFLKRFFLDKIRFGKRILKPNLIVTARR